MRKGKTTVLVLAIIIGLAYAFCPRPDIDSYAGYSSAYFDRHGTLLRLTLAADDRYRLHEDLANIDPEFIEATLLYEDQNFYTHPGVDFFALLRAFWTTYLTKERRVGASTIAMQVARLLWDIPSNKVSGKIHQILRAIQLSRHYSKAEILQAYLNLAPYGRNIEGITAASLIYFNKKPADLNLLEALTLAVVPQNPVKRNPTTDNGYRHLLKARNLLFERWVEHHPDDLNKRKFFSLPFKLRSPEQLPFVAPHYINYLQANTSKWDSGTIDTSLDTIKQFKVEDAIRNYIASNAVKGINNASALVLNYQTMTVEAMVGSTNFYNNDIQGQVNGATAKRSPGSTLKPFVYALSMDEGLIHPMSLLKDSPRRFGGFTPENYDRKFVGPISARDALIQSRNVPAVDLQAQLKRQSFYQFLLDAGVSDLKDESFYGLALALGGGEVSMLELATLYASLANGGLMKPIRFLQNDAGHTGRRLLSEEASYLTLDILRDNPAPSQLNINSNSTLDNDIAWKTGTSWAFRDAWAVGISGPYVVLVWIGNFDGRGNEVFVGRSAAGPLMFSIVNAIFPDQGWKLADAFVPENLNLKRLLVCSATGDLYEKHCPSSTESWFIPGVSPIKVSNIYRKIPIDRATGLRACWHSPGLTEVKVYEFWPSDLMFIFNQAGISLKVPPKYLGSCSMDQKSASGQMPIITSPQSTLEYMISTNSDHGNLIPLVATVDPDVVRIYWFVDSKYVGSSSDKRAFLWQAIPGKFELRAVDDSGRSASKIFVVSQVN